MKKLVLGFFMTVFSVAVSGQSVLNALTPDQIREGRSKNLESTNDSVYTQSKPLEYGFIEDKDVAWSKIVWEVIDFNERLNQPYYLSGDRFVQNTKSMYDVVVDALREGKITEVYDDEYFENKLSYDQVMARTSKVDTQQIYRDMVAAGEKPDEGAIFNFKIDTKDIKMIKVKGVWYIDKRLGELKYRLLGIAIMGPDAQSLGTEYSDGTLVDLFWIWYPDTRKILANVNVFNPGNSSSPITFDEMLNARRFSSIIYKTQTSHGVRTIDEYIPNDSKRQLEESNAIRNSIIQKESDMWNY